MPDQFSYTGLYRRALIVLLDDVTTSNVSYIGKAAPGTATSAAKWQIAKLNVAGTPVTLDLKFAAEGAFTQIWDNRASLTYA